jgi:multiple sugar transport system permease protein
LASETLTKTGGGSRWARVRRRLDSASVLGPLLAAPAVLLLGGLLAYPLLLGLWLSLTDSTLGSPSNFIGIRNYVRLLADPVFRGAAAYALIYTFGTVVFKMGLGLALALLLNRQFRGYRFARSLMLLPWVVPTVLSALAWLWLLDPQFSAISWLLMKLGLIGEGINFLGEAWPARLSLITVNIWRGIPYFAIGYMAGLQAIPKELYEAAAIDGASNRKAFVAITWPLLFPITAILVSFSSIWTITDFQLVWTITRGGPVNATQVFTTLAYQRAITSGSLGEGAAIAMSVIPVMLVFAYFALRSMRER